MIINLTPHDIVLRTANGDVTIPASGTIARVATVDTDTGDTVSGLPVIRRSFGDVTGLPADDTPVIVSAMVLAAVPGRRNTFAPDTGPTAIRDDAGRIVAVTRLVAA
jgi:hypothetical protein